jgi:hypothetical protein
VVYHVSAWLNRVAFIPNGGARRLYATGSDYIAHGPRRLVTLCGVPVVTIETTYDRDTFRLAAIRAVRLADHACCRMCVPKRGRPEDPGS